MTDLRILSSLELCQLLLDFLFLPFSFFFFVPVDGAAAGTSVLTTGATIFWDVALADEDEDEDEDETRVMFTSPLPVAASVLVSVSVLSLLLLLPLDFIVPGSILTFVSGDSGDLLSESLTSEDCCLASSAFFAAAAAAVAAAAAASACSLV